MKTIILTLIAGMLSYMGSARDSLLVKANSHYAQGEYEQAKLSYQNILDSNIASAEVYYNLGNTFFKTGEYTRAIINYERARLLAPNDEDIAFNLALANQHVVDAIEPLPQLFFVRWWHNFSDILTADQWAVISIVAFLATLALAALFFFGRSPAAKKAAFWSGILVLTISLISFNLGARQHKMVTAHRFAIIIEPRVTVKSSPSESGTDLFMIHEGLKVEVRDSLGSWREIKLADGNIGWLPASSIEKI